MRAAVYRRYGPPDVVRVEEVAAPEPRAGEVLIRVRASTVSAGDWRARSLKVPPGFGLFARPIFGLFGPRKRLLGTELAGVVEAVGSAVTRFAVGDPVFAFPGVGMGGHERRQGAAAGRGVEPTRSGKSFKSPSFCPDLGV